MPFAHTSGDGINLCTQGFDIRFQGYGGIKYASAVHNDFHTTIMAEAANFINVLSGYRQPFIQIK